MSVWHHFCRRFMHINQGKFPLWWIWHIWIFKYLDEYLVSVKILLNYNKANKTEDVEIGERPQPTGRNLDLRFCPVAPAGPRVGLPAGRRRHLHRWPQHRKMTGLILNFNSQNKEKKKFQPSLCMRIIWPPLNLDLYFRMNLVQPAVSSGRPAGGGLRRLAGWAAAVHVGGDDLPLPQPDRQLALRDDQHQRQPPPCVLGQWHHRHGVLQPHACQGHRS